MQQKQRKEDIKSMVTFTFNTQKTLTMSQVYLCIFIFLKNYKYVDIL